MKKNDYIISIDGVTDRRFFITSLFSFYSAFDVELTIWGKLPHSIHELISPFRLSTSVVQLLFRSGSRWRLNHTSVDALTTALCNNDILKNITWGLIKDNIPLGLCREWDDMNVVGSSYIQEETLIGWLNQLKEKGIIESYEKITE